MEESREEEDEGSAKKAGAEDGQEAAGNDVVRGSFGGVVDGDIGWDCRVVGGKIAGGDCEWKKACKGQGKNGAWTGS